MFLAHRYHAIVLTNAYLGALWRYHIKWYGMKERIKTKKLQKQKHLISSNWIHFNFCSATASHIENSMLMTKCVHLFTISRSLSVTQRNRIEILSLSAVSSVYSIFFSRVCILICCCRSCSCIAVVLRRVSELFRLSSTFDECHQRTNALMLYFNEGLSPPIIFHTCNRWARKGEKKWLWRLTW